VISVSKIKYRKIKETLHYS